MAGFKLPKLRWLLIGAAATGIWAATQEPPKRDHWQRRDAAETKAYEEKRQAAVRRERPTPSVAAAPAPKPSSLKTASIPRPQVDIAKEEPLRVVEKVRLRKEPTTSSDIVAVLAPGATVLGSETEGKWRRVHVDGKVGWVHTDYLNRKDPIADIVAAVPRPSEPIPDTTAPNGEEDAQPASMPGPAPVDASIWGAMRPTRAPQGGDCQCPYDLMLSGKECGSRSAYSRGREVACYF